MDVSRNEETAKRYNGITSRATHLSFGHQTAAVVNPALVSSDWQTVGSRLQVGGLLLVVDRMDRMISIPIIIHHVPKISTMKEWKLGELN